MNGRREFLKGAVLGAGLFALRAPAEEKKKAKTEGGEDVSPAETSCASTGS